MRSVFPPPPASQSTAEINALLASRGSDFRVRSQVPGAVAKVVGGGVTSGIPANADIKIEPTSPNTIHRQSLIPRESYISVRLPGMDTDVTLTFYRLSKVSQPDGLKYLKFKGDDGREYITDGNIDSNQGLRLAVKEKGTQDYHRIKNRVGSRLANF